MKVPYIVISRDGIRFSMLKDSDDYFAHEDEVFAEFRRQIQAAIDEDVEMNIFVDATHLSEKARNKTLDGLRLEGVDLYAVAMDIPMGVCLDQNEQREGRAYVPRSVIRRMWYQYQPPTENEKYKYHILTVSRKEGEEEDE
jgi:predicted kinase